ncbi:MAG: hypothetical protein IK017_01085 [Paludibacteraceae bacterium]|nr:hypothetical protein [Paludibacteraceae bacterium]
MKGKLIVKTKKSQLVLGIILTIVCIVSSILFFGAGFQGYSEESPHRVDVILCCLIIGLVCLIFGVAFALFFWRIKDDYIQIDSKGITINAHSSNTFFQKHYQDSYQWSDLSSYALDLNVKDTRKGIVFYEYHLEVYDVNGLLLKKYEFQHAFGKAMSELDDYMSDHLQIKQVHEFNKYGKTTLNARKTNNGYVRAGIMGFCSLFMIYIAALYENERNYLYGFIAFCCLAGIWFFYTNKAKNKDSLTFDQDGISVDIHTRELCRHIQKKVNYDSIHSFSVSYDTEECQLKLWDEEEKELLSCDCIGLSYSRYLDYLLKGILM